MSSQLDAPDPEQATSFSPERQLTLLLFYSPQHSKTNIFGHCLLDSINYPARKLYMGDTAPCDFKKWDTAPGLQLKHSISLHSINIRYSNNGLNIKAICFFNIPAWSVICATQRRFLHLIIGPVQFLAVLEQS